MIGALGLLVAALVVAWDRDARGPRRFAPALTALVAAGVTLALRGDLPPAGWASMLVLAAALVELLIVGLAADVSPTVRAGGLLVAAAAALTVPGPGVIGWCGWAWPHVLASLSALALLGLAGAIASTAVARQPLVHAAVALVLLGLPLLDAERGAAVHASTADGPATALVEFRDPETGHGHSVSAPALTPAAGARSARWLATGLALLALLSAAAWSAAGRTVRTGPVRLVLAVAGGIALAPLLWALVPRVIDSDGSATVDLMTALARRAATLGEVPKLTLPEGPLTGGLGASGALLVWSLVCAWFCAAPLATSDVPAPAASRPLLRFAMALGLLSLSLAGATGIIWSNFAWGGPVLPDPRLYGHVAVMGLSVTFFLARTAVPAASVVPSLLALGAWVALLATMLGPELGWLSPTLHRFGP